VFHISWVQYTATHCNTLQHIATHCNTLQHTATHIVRGTPHFGELSISHRARLSPVAVCRRLQCVAVCCRVLQHVVVCCSVLQYVAVCCSVLPCVAHMNHSVRRLGCLSKCIWWVCLSKCVAACCSVLQQVAVCYSVWHAFMTQFAGGFAC